MKIFDLEQQIMQCWDVVTDLELVKGETADALRHIYQLKFEKLFETFEEACAEYHASRREEKPPKTHSFQDNAYFPDKWVVLRWPSGACKLLVSWGNDPLLDGKGQLSDEITRVEEYGEGLIFHDASGSEYCVFALRYGLSAVTEDVYDEIEHQVELLSGVTNWLEMDWNASVGQPWLRTYDGTQE